MQTVGRPALPPTASPRRTLALVVIAGIIATTAFVLIVGNRDALPPDSALWSPLETAERFNELYEQGRVAEFQALISPRARWCMDDECTRTVPFYGSIYAHESQTAYESMYLAATHGTLGADCSAQGPTVECVWHQSNTFFEVGGIEPWVGYQSFTVEAGLITRYTGAYRYQGVTVFDRVQQNQYSRWVEATYPDEHGTLFEDQLMLVFTGENRARHRELTTEWASELGF